MKNQSKSETDEPAELFRMDFISNMKVADAEQLDLKNICRFTESWRHEWNCGVQVPFKEGKALKCPRFKVIHDVHEIKQGPSTESSKSANQYDSDLLDVKWLALFNKHLTKLGIQQLTTDNFEMAMELLELATHGKPVPCDASPNYVNQDDSVCDVCQSPSWEDGNEIVFCDSCNIGVHRMCYGIKRIPKGSWYCRPCSLGVKPKCILCPNRGGAMKSNRTCDQWVHISCALWIPEIMFENKDAMEPAVNLNSVPNSRFALRCCLCTNRGGACIQCKNKSCRAAFHVTCAQKNGLQLISVPNFESYCLRHVDSTKRDDEMPSPQRCRMNSARPAVHEPKEWLVNIRQNFLQNSFNLPRYVVQSLFYYWRLKKVSNLGRPFIRVVDSDKVVNRQHEEQLIRRVQLLMFLRQNMEKARNLCYMIERREKVKRQEYISAGEYVRCLYEKYANKVPVVACQKSSHISPQASNRVLTNSALCNIHPTLHHSSAESPPLIMSRTLLDSKFKIGRKYKSMMNGCIRNNNNFAILKRHSSPQKTPEKAHICSNSPMKCVHHLKANSTTSKYSMTYDHHHNANKRILMESPMHNHKRLRRSVTHFSPV